MKTVKLLLVLLIINGGWLFELRSQNAKQVIDSLSQVAMTAPDSLKYNIYNKIGFHYVFSDRSKADSILKKGIKEARNSGYTYGVVLMTNTYGINFDINREYDSAFYYFEKALKLAREYKFKTLEIRTLNNLGMNAWGQDRLDEAQEFFFEALRQTRTYRPKERTDIYLSNIGLIFQELQQTDKALEYHNQALEERIVKNFIREQIISYNNIGINYRLKEAYNKALEALDNGLEIIERKGVYEEYQRLYINKGNVYINMGNYSSAVKSFEKAKEGPPNGNNDPKEYFEAVSGLSYAFFLDNNLTKARGNLEEGLDILIDNPSFSDKGESFYKTASAIYFADGDKEKGSLYIDSLQTILKRKFSQENAKAIAVAETRFETAEKEVALAKIRASLAERELEVRQRNNIIYGVIGLAFLLALVGYLFYNQQRLKNEQLKKESKLKEALAKIETQNHLQEQRLRISRDLHDNIGSQLTFIISTLDSLKYGLKDEDHKVKDRLSEVGDFTKNTINELRDTIWAMNKEHITLEDLEARIANLLEQARNACLDTDFSLKFQEQIDKNQSLSSVEGVTLYRIIQEAINNAIKHAKASHIEVLVSIDQNRLTTTIKDDGNGFDMKSPELGNGLHNMKRRAKDVMADYDLQSTIGEGTVVSIGVTI